MYVPDFSVYYLFPLRLLPYMIVLKTIEHIVGNAASVGTCLLYVPQLYKTITSQTVEGLSIHYIMFSIVVCVLWLVYAVIVYSIPMIIAQTCLFVQLVSLFLLYHRYSQRRQTPTCSVRSPTPTIDQADKAQSTVCKASL